MGTRVDGVERFQRFLASWRFPVVTLAVLTGFELLIFGLLVTPAQPGFSEDFKVWCFGYDPKTGSLQWGYVVVMLGQPLLVGGVIASVWRRPLREVLTRSPWSIVPYLAGAAIAVGLAAMSFVTLGVKQSAADALPFPAQTLRTELTPPHIALENQDGKRVTLEQLRGDVVLLTGVYASCPRTCPLIMAQAKRAIGSLTPEQRHDVRFVAITLDPEHDSPAVLAKLARAHGVEAPDYDFLTGPPREVNDILDELSIPREMDMSSGLINHPALFILLDRAGRIAYRLSLGARQERWLEDALRTLLAEPPNERT
jgi:protein SCO1/2